MGWGDLYLSEINRALKIGDGLNRSGVIIGTVQILALIMLFWILVVLVALLITLNPDLDAERRALVSPIVRGLVSPLMRSRQNELDKAVVKMARKTR